MRSTRFESLSLRRRPSIIGPILSRPSVCSTRNLWPHALEAELSLAHKLPSLFGPKHHVEAGGLMSYSPDRADLWRRGALYVDKILRGIDPADLPVQQSILPST